MLFLMIAMEWFFLVSTPWLPDLMIKTLENRYSPLLEIPESFKDDTVHVVVLAAGRTPDPRLPEINQLSNTSLGRLNEGIRIFLQLNDGILIVSGSNFNYSESQALTTLRAAQQLGIDSASIRMLTTPTNTFEEAKGYVSEFGESTHVILVTNATHMPRAMKYFYRVGVDPIPAPTNHFLKARGKRQWLSWLPSSSNIRKVEVASHEYAGLLAVRFSK